MEQTKMQQELQKAHDELERQVEERTAELKSAVEERMQTLAALRESEELLIHQSRLAAMGEMIDNITHQWRQPLNSLGLIVQELAMQLERGGLSEQYLAEKLGSAQNLIFCMSQTVKDFRYFFRPVVEREVFKSADAIAMALNLISHSLESDEIEVEVEVVGEPAVQGYANELSQVLVNILLNCRDAFLELKGCHSRTIRIRTFCENGRTVITITDNAGGIAEHVIGKIFDQYFTTKSPDKGTGIGLFIAKMIIEKHMAGSFTARNSGPGAEFRIEVGSSG